MVAVLLRFQRSKSGDELFCFKGFVDWLKEGLQDICYITGESVAAVSSSPFLETLRVPPMKRPRWRKWIDRLVRREFVRSCRARDIAGKWLHLGIRICMKGANLQRRRSVYCVLCSPIVGKKNAQMYMYSSLLLPIQSIGDANREQCGCVMRNVSVQFPSCSGHQH